VSLASWFTQVAYVASLASVSSYGVPTFGAARVLRCRVEASRKLLRKPGGDEGVSTHVLYTDQVVALTDRIWLPGVSTATADGARSPMSVTTSADKAGARTLYEVAL
jgi:hypothetical protein